MIHLFCHGELAIILAALPFFRWFIKPCCTKMMETWHEHLKHHKDKQNGTSTKKTKEI